MSNKKMIVSIILLAVLLALFMNYAFKKIQTVELKITTSTSQEIDEDIKRIIKEIDEIKDVAFIGKVTLSDIQILFIDHLDEEAVFWENGNFEVVEYESLNKTIISGNSYVVYISKKPTLILNCDPILGDVVERATMLIYQYLIGNMSALNPSEISYFQTLNENIKEQYYRYEMIEAMKRSYFENESFEQVYHYYYKWSEILGEKHLIVGNYDYYDGLKMYALIKIKTYRNPDFNLEEYVNGKMNIYGIYSKEDSYSVAGLLWFLLADRDGVDVFSSDDVKTDRYKILLQGTPLITIEDKNAFESYEVKYKNYIKDIEYIVEISEKYINTVEPISLNLISEKYDETIKIDDNYYIYINYVARYDNLNLIKREYIITKVSPYKIHYYLDPYNKKQ